MPHTHERITKMLETYRRELPKPPEDSPPQVCRGYRCIKQHLFSPRLTVRWLKDECNINGNNFSGKFRYYVGNPPKSYYLEHRIKVSKKLFRILAHEDVSILNIALSVGFKSHASFTMTFKEYEGKSPKEFKAESLK